ncbi:hypothetical protein Ahy_B03g063148 [Arachis hypogaea]|uniref:Uncharacterized protein n=1 Tax=Arachis hypogaea TaxID=3818 RepID=A0A444ZWH5_ARAHY|nr:hypothetical protein Ahy_B03g063148 [Arachis hypogaea]
MNGTREKGGMNVEPLLTSSVPNLSLDNLIINLNASGGELNTNGGLGFKAELIPCEAREKVRFSDARVTDQHHLEESELELRSKVKEKEKEKEVIPIRAI